MQNIRTRLAEGFELVASRWAMWLAAAVFGGVCSVLVYAATKSISSDYTVFIAGPLALGGTGKLRDYAMLIAFITGATVFLAWAALLFQRLSAMGGATRVEEAHAQFIIAIIPALTWFATFLIPRTLDTGLFWTSALLVIATIAALWMILKRDRFWLAAERDTLFPAALNSLAIVSVTAIFAALAVGMIGNRFGLRWFESPAVLHWWIAVTVLLTVAAAAAILMQSRAPGLALTRLRKLTVAIQVLLPGLWLMLLPLPMEQSAPGNGVPAGVRPETWMLIGCLSAVTWADLIRLWCRNDSDNPGPVSAVSFFSLIAVLAFCRAPEAVHLVLASDDYHFGEDLVPWWSWTVHHMIPLWDFTPPRGLVNYAMGGLAALFTAPSAEGMLETAPYQFTAVLLIVGIPLSCLVGKWPAFLMLAFATLDDRIGGIDAIMTAGFCVLVLIWNGLSHTRWLLAWLLVGTTAVLVAPGQGGLLVMATAPGGLWRLYCAVRDERKSLLIAAACVMAVAAILCLTTPLGLMVAGAVRYGAGQAAANIVANGTAWRSSFGTAPELHAWLFEILRFSWVGAGTVAGALTLWIWARRRQHNHTQLLFVGGTVTVLCLLYIMRSAARLDPAYVSRSGWTSIWALAFLLPILLMFFLRGTARLTAMAVTMTCAAALTQEFAVAGPDKAFQRPFAVARAAPTADSAAHTLPRAKGLGLDDAHVSRLVGVKSLLDRLLAPDETYLDMTNRGAHYYYFYRPPPTEVIAYYNMITPAQQRRAIAALEQRNVSVALTYADNIVLDGLPASLRTPLLYRYLLLNFVPARLDNYDFMLRPDRLARIGAPMADPDSPSEATLKILDRDFLRRDLAGLPGAWGDSADHLSGEMRVVVDLDGEHAAAMANVAAEAADSFRVIGPHPAVTYDLSAAHIRGRDAGLLQFEYVCKNGSAKPILGVSWTANGVGPDPQNMVHFPARKGTFIVPLDAAPRWILSPVLDTLRIEMIDPAGCEAFTLRRVILLQRTDVDELNTALGHTP